MINFSIYMLTIYPHRFQGGRS